MPRNPASKYLSGYEAVNLLRIRPFELVEPIRKGLLEPLNKYGEPHLLQVIPLGPGEKYTQEEIGSQARAEVARRKQLGGTLNPTATLETSWRTISSVRSR